ncbi:MAG: TonB-dependent receptor [Acidobacteria bacterium]|nr:TonB-dependent receptor [Acidobacteriota bacterium]
MGQLNIGGGITTIGLSTVGRNLSNIFTYADDVFLTRGQHDLRLGIFAQRHQNNDFFDFRFQGVYSFNGLEDFLRGAPVTYDGQMPGSSTRRGWRQTVVGVYIQDNFRVRPNFTLNLGLRYEATTTPTEVNGLIVNQRDPLKDAEGTFGEPFFRNPSKRNFAPRIGLAWDPFGNEKTSVRGGFGIFHETMLFYQYANQGRRQSPLSQSVRINNPAFPIPELKGIEIARVENVAEYQPHQPYMMQWNLTVQRELFGQTAFTVAYVGSRGVNLGGTRITNVAVPEILPDGRKFFAAGLPRRNRAFDDIFLYDYGYNSFYHSLQLSGRKRFTAGLQFQGSYTWGRSIDEASRMHSGDFSGPSREPQDPYDVKASSRGLSDHHIGQVFSFNFAYALPITGLSGFAKKIAEGWQINGILNLSTGNPIQINLGSGSGLFDYNRDRASGQERPSVKAGRSPNPVLGGPDMYFDPTAFELQPPGFYGNVGRNTLVSPGVAAFDFSLSKNTPLRESVNLQFRAEFFNIFNRANFGNPNSSVFSSARGDFANAVGRIVSTSTTSRQIQFGLRLVF